MCNEWERIESVQDGGKARNKEGHSKDRGADGRMRLERISETLAGACGEDRGPWRPVVNTVTNIRVLAPRCQPRHKASKHDTFHFYYTI
jgi:hypothetical protein